MSNLFTQLNSATKRRHLYDSAKEGSKSYCGKEKFRAKLQGYMISSPLFWDVTDGACLACFDAHMRATVHVGESILEKGGHGS